MITRITKSLRTQKVEHKKAELGIRSVGTNAGRDLGTSTTDGKVHDDVRATVGQFRD